MRVFDRLRLPGLLVGVLAFALVGCGGGGGGSDASDAETLFAVVQEIPTNGQEVAGDLSDVDGIFEIKFSTDLDEDTILDPANPFNGLSADLNMLNNMHVRVAGTPEVKGKYFRFIPPSTGLPPQQYTVTVTRNITSAGGQSLPREYYTSFTVGPDNYEPIIRRTNPVQNQSNVARDTEIVLTFNESLDPGSVNSQTVLIQDGGQNPPVTIPGTLSLQNNGFEIHFTPDPTSNLPPETTVVVTLQGGSGGIADKTTGKPFLDSAGTQTFTLQFNTTSGGDPVNQFARSSCYFVDNRSFGVIDIAVYAGGTPMPGSNGRQVLDNSRRKIGAPGEIVIDPRINGNGDTFAYVVDMNSSSVAVVNTFNSKVVGRIQARGPRGLAIAPSGVALWVSEFSADSLTYYSIRLAAPGFDFWSDSQDSLVGSAVKSATTQVGRGPTGAANAPQAPFTFVANSLEGSCSIIRESDDTIFQTWATGDYPADVAISPILTLQGDWFAVVTNLGGGAAAPGSASFWWNGNPQTQLRLVTGLQNPRGVLNVGAQFYVANSGTSGISEISVQYGGGWIYTTFVATLTNTFHTGRNPQNVAIDPVNGLFLFSSDLGDGIVSVAHSSDTNFSLPIIEVPGVKYVATLVNQ